MIRPRLSLIHIFLKAINCNIFGRGITTLSHSVISTWKKCICRERYTPSCKLLYIPLSKIALLDVTSYFMPPILFLSLHF